MEYAHVYDVLTQARRRLFDWVRPLSQEQYTKQFPFGMGTLRKTLIEIAAVELMYTKRLRGDALPPQPGLPPDFPIGETKQPAFAELERVWTAQAPQTRAILAGISDWAQTVTRRIEQGDTVTVSTASKADIATQMLMHEVHHRAQAMAMLRQLGVAAENLDYISFVVRRQEYPKDKAPRG
ncbi:MAG TPA: DinB family protein [bacterium]|nr:DinB family protein [bacterium]